MGAPDLPCGGEHDFDQGGRCECGADRADVMGAGSRRTGGAGSLTQPLSDDDYRRARRKLERQASH